MKPWIPTLIWRSSRLYLSSSIFRRCKTGLVHLRRVGAIFTNLPLRRSSWTIPDSDGCHWHPELTVLGVVISGSASSRICKRPRYGQKIDTDDKKIGSIFEACLASNYHRSPCTRFDDRQQRAHKHSERRPAIRVG